MKTQKRQRSNKCKCAQDKIIFWKTENIRSKFEQCILLKIKSNPNLNSKYQLRLKLVLKLQILANANSPHSPSLQEQIPQRMKAGIGTFLDNNLPKSEMTPSPAAPDENKDNNLGLDYRVEVEALDDWATVTRFSSGNVGYVVQEPEITNDFQHFIITMYGSNWEKSFGLPNHDI